MLTNFDCSAYFVKNEAALVQTFEILPEYLKTTDYVEYMILPRLSALSEVVWTEKEGKNFEDFKSRLKVLRKRYDVLGLNYGKHVFTD